jgi:hypothetical protein
MPAQHTANPLQSRRAAPHSLAWWWAGLSRSSRLTVSTCLRSNCAPPHHRLPASPLAQRSLIPSPRVSAAQERRAGREREALRRRGARPSRPSSRKQPGPVAPRASTPGVSRGDDASRARAPRRPHRGGPRRSTLHTSRPATSRARGKRARRPSASSCALGTLPPPRAACGTRRVQLVRGEGRGVSTWYEGGGTAARSPSRPSPPPAPPAPAPPAPAPPRARAPARPSAVGP